MSINQALVAHLREDPDIDRRCDGRVYQMVAPQGAAFPYATVQQFGGLPVRHMAAASGFVEGTFQISVFDRDVVAVEEFFNEIREQLDHLLNATIGVPPFTAKIQSATLQGVFHEHIAPTDAGGVGKFGIRATWTVWYEQTVPVFVTA